jgi:hypothetical protein
MIARLAHRGSRFLSQSYSPSPAYGAGACVFIPGGLFTTSKCSSSKITHGTILINTQFLVGAAESPNPQTVSNGFFTPRHLPRIWLFEFASPAAPKSHGGRSFRISNFEFCPASPKLPIPLPHDPHSQQEIRDRMRHHCVSQPVLPDHQPLKRHTTNNPAQPLVMHQTKQ